MAVLAKDVIGTDVVLVGTSVVGPWDIEIDKTHIFVRFQYVMLLFLSSKTEFVAEHFSYHIHICKD